MSVPIAAGAVVYAKNVSLLAAFYAGVAGLRETHSESGHVVLEAAGFQLIVFAIPPQIAASFQIATPPQRREDTPIKLVFAVRSLAAARAAARSLGGELDPEDKAWEFQGSRVCDGHDPEGNVIQVRQHGGNPMELNTARVFVADIAAARSFYETTLALPLKIDGEGDGLLVFRSGGLDLIVEAVPADAPDDDRGLVGRFTGLSFTVPDIQSRYTELLAKGVAFSGAPEPQAWGGTLATFMDPAGNGLQLVQGRAA